MPSIRAAPRRVAAFLLVAAVSGGAFGGVASAARGPAPARCEIALSGSGSSFTLTALAHAEKPIAGRYSLRVSGRGTDIRQGGSFEAAPARPATLGTMMLGAAGAGYRAELDLDLGSGTLSCSRRIGGGP